MLDDQTQVEDVAEAVEDPAPEEELTEVVALDGEDPEATDEAVFDEAEADDTLGPQALAAVRKTREAYRASRDEKKTISREVRELRAKLAEIEAANKPVVEEAKRPTLEDCGFNEDVFAEKMAAFVVDDTKRKADVEADKARQKTQADAYQAKLDNYHAVRGKVGVDDDAQARVVAVLSPQQQTALMDAALDPAKVVAALAKSPKALAELAEIKEIHKFAYKLANIEGKIQMTSKAPPPPESKLRGGGAVADAVSAVPLDKLRERAEASGDYSSYFAEKRRRAESGTKA